MMQRLWLIGLLGWFSLVPAWAQSSPGMLQDLVLPEGTQAPYPAVMLLHGCNGIEPNVPAWQRVLRDRGYASVVVDSFRRRGFSEICTNLSRLPVHERVNDAYKALTELAGRTDIDPQRVVVMGFSHGAVTTLSALTNVVAAQIPKAHVRFRAGIAVYPECGVFSYALFVQPVLVLIGEQDDWTPAAPCIDLAKKFAGKQPSFETIVYPKAHHGFDIPGLSYRYLSNATNLNKRSGLGATAEGNDQARTQAMADALAFLDRTLR
jgi:dienelactone hydrolase